MSSLSIDLKYQKKVRTNTWAPIQLNFKLRALSILFAQVNSRIEVTIPVDFTRATGGVQIARYEKFDDYYWIEATKSDFSTAPITIKSPATMWDMSSSFQYILLLSTINGGSSNNGFLYPSTYGYYPIQITAYTGPSTAKEVFYDYIVLEPIVDEMLLEFEALNRQAGHYTILRFKWQLSVAAVAGDEIWIELTSNNGYYAGSSYVDYTNNSKVFANDLGTGGQNVALDCQETAYATLISTTKVFCDVLRHGDDTQIPPNDFKPIIRLKITKAIPVNTQLGWFVAGIKNPAYNSRRAVITVSLRKISVQAAFTLLSSWVPYQISKGEYTTTVNTVYFNPAAPTASIAYYTAAAVGTGATTFSASGVTWDLA